jgi:hypothetical protein
MKPHRNFVKRLCTRLGGHFLDAFLVLDHLTSNTNNRIIGIEQISDTNREKIAIFATYSGRNFDKSDISVLKTLKDRGYAVVVVSNGEKTDIEKCSTLISYYLLRENLGFDLASFRDAFRQFGRNATQILFINDSIIWPRDNFTEMLEKMEHSGKAGEVVGVTESLQRVRHLQSFCFYVAGEASIAKFGKTLELIRNWRFKRTAVSYGELRLSSKFEGSSLKLVPIFPYESIVRAWSESNIRGRNYEDIRYLISRNVSLNPTQHFWNIILDLPGGFVKRSLLENNPAGLADLPSDNFLN